jgi:hypothetical protein
VGESVTTVTHMTLWDLSSYRSLIDPPTLPGLYIESPSRCVIVTGWRRVSDRAGRGSLVGRRAPRPDGRPNLVGALTLEQALPAGSRLWLNGWTCQAGGESFVSLSAVVAQGSPRRRWRARDVENERVGKFTSVGDDGA